MVGELQDPATGCLIFVTGAATSVGKLLLNMEQGCSLSDLTVTFMFSFCFYIVTAPQVE